MKKVFYIILAILILVSIYFALYHRKIDIEHYSFSIEDTSKISSFEISEKNHKVTISKNSGEWFVNDTYHANQFYIKQVLRIFSNLEISLLISDEKTDSTINVLKKNSISVKFYRNGSVLNEFLVGDFNSKTNSTMAMNDDDVVAYITSPGLSHDIRKFVEADDIFWRDRLIFSMKPSEISSVELSDYRNPENSFIIENKGDNYLLFNNKKREQNYKEENLLRYLSYFSNINFESIAKDLEQKQQDSIINTRPVYSLKVDTKTGQHTHLNLYLKENAKKYKEDDLNYIYGNINNEKLILLISYFQIDPVLKSIEYFK